MVTWPVVLERYTTIMTFPAAQPDFIPSLLPIFLGLFVIEIYFGRYSYEELGWNSAVSNSVSIIATALTLILQLDLLGVAFGPRTVVAYGILAVGVLIFLLNFYHVWPPEIAFNLSSAFVSSTLVYLAIAIVYTGLRPTGDTLAAGGLVFATLWVFFKVVKGMQREVVPRRARRR